MKKIVITTALLFCACSVSAFKFTGLPWEASQPYMETMSRNFLPWNASELEQQYGMKVYIFKFTAGTKIDSSRLAAAYYNTITRTADDKILLIWACKKQNDGIIMASDALKKIIPEEVLNVLQEDILRPLANKWYISEQRVYSKILGTILYILKKPFLDKTALEAMKGRYIKIDDPLYKISLMQPFYDILKLFYFEPISFCLYFPFIMYAFLVRLIGMNSGKKVFIFLNLIWLGLTGFIFVLLLNRVNIIFPEYVSLWSFYVSLNVPLYIILFALYWDRIEVAAYGYLYEVTGGFGSNSSFGPSK
jgi:hypothetical protein